MYLVTSSKSSERPLGFTYNTTPRPFGKDRLGKHRTLQCKGIDTFNSFLEGDPTGVSATSGHPQEDQAEIKWRSVWPESGESGQNILGDTN